LLESLARQKRLPDELVVSDNCSTDHSVELVGKFSGRAPFPVKLLINDSNVGVTKNFEHAIRACTGDIVFMADCDDVWYPDKLLAMEQALDRYPRAGVAVCDADIVDDELRPIGSRLWQLRQFNPSSHVSTKMAEGKGFPRSLPTWANCMAIRAKFLPLVLPMPDGETFRRGAQDTFVAWTIAYSGAAGIAAVPRPLIAYRQHRQQMTGAGNHRYFGFFAQRFAGRAERATSPTLMAVRERLERLNVENPVNLNIRKEVLHHWSARRNLPDSRLARLPVVMRELLAMRYHHYSSGLVTAVKDLLFVSKHA
jgi:glycosyltransferase involved in cell wall biosynthesis